MGQVCPQRLAQCLAGLVALLDTHMHEAGLCVVNACPALQRPKGHSAGPRTATAEFLETPASMRRTQRRFAQRVHRSIERRVLASVLIRDQGAHPRWFWPRWPLAAKECDRVLRSSPQAELADHPGLRIMVAARPSPDIGLARLARTRVKQRYRCFVGMQHSGTQNEAPQCFVQGLQRRLTKLQRSAIL